jgi:hypothetical protein
MKPVDEATVFKLLPTNAVDQVQARAIGLYLGVKIQTAKQQQSVVFGGVVAVIIPLLVNSIRSDLGASFSPMIQTLLDWMPIAVLSVCAISLLVAVLAVKEAEAMLVPLKLTAAISQKVQELGRIMAVGTFFGKQIARLILKD